MTDEEELAHVIGDDPDVRFVGDVTKHPLEVWYNRWMPSYRITETVDGIRSEHPIIGFTFEDYDWDSIPHPDEMEDVLVMGEEANVLFTDVMNAIVKTVDDCRVLTLVADDVVECDF